MIPADPVAALIRNRYFLSQLWGLDDPEDHLEADDDAFQEFDALRSEHGREESPDDEDDLIVQSITVPLFLPKDHVWEIEHYDNSEDAGVIHRLQSPDGPIELAVVDAHPSGIALTWPELELVAGAAERDERNRASDLAAIVPLLLFRIVSLTASDDRESIRARLADAWQHSGLEPAAAAALAAQGAAKRATTGRKRDDKKAAALKQLLAALE